MGEKFRVTHLFLEFRFRYLQIRRTTIRMLAEIMYRQDPEKILGLRIDSLSQLISYSNVCATGNFLLYESGTNGLVTAAILNAIGANTGGKLLHLHQGNVPQKLALQALNLEQEQLDRCISANIYSILRQYYQKNGGMKRKFDDIADDETKCVSAKLTKIDDDNVSNQSEMATNQMDLDDDTANGPEHANGGATVAVEQQPNEENKEAIKTKTTPKWVIENERGCELLRENLDALIIVAKEHPVAILNTLLPFVKSSRPIVVFQLSRDILMETFIDLKSGGKVTGLKLTSNWLRLYQVLPNRTHPDVNMSGNSGFVLHGYTVR